jgi:hypothetical protein
MEDKIWIENIEGVMCKGDEVIVLSHEKEPYYGTKYKKVFDIDTGELKSEKTYKGYKLKDWPLIILPLIPGFGVPLLVPQIRKEFKDRISRINGHVDYLHNNIWVYEEGMMNRVNEILGEEIRRVGVYFGGIEEAERETGKKLEPIKLDSSEKFIRAHSQKELKIDALGLGANAIVNYSFQMGKAKGTPVKFEETKT